MLTHPMSATDLLAVLLAAALTALVQLPIAGWALFRYHRSRGAKAGTSDGQGVVTLEDGSTVRSDAPSGPVLVVPGRAAESGYRAAAARSASLVATGSRAEIEGRLRDDALLAVVAAHGALAIGIAPMLLLAWYGFRVPF